LRRRRALRDLDHLAEETGREWSPTAAIAHVRVIGGTTDPAGASDQEPTLPKDRGHAVESLPVFEQPAEEPRPAVSRIRAVPIDQAFSDH
jgi:plasmid stabilization system protein ParE